MLPQSDDMANLQPDSEGGRACVQPGRRQTLADGTNVYGVQYIISRRFERLVFENRISTAVCWILSSVLQAATKSLLRH